MLKDALLIIRADAGAKIGTGHVMRAIALGSAWKRAGGIAVLITAADEALTRRAEGSFTRLYSLGTTKSGVLEIIETIRLIKNISVIFHSERTWLALDGSHFNEYYQRALTSLSFPLLVIDDSAHLLSYYGDIILNQNAGAEKLEYSHKNSSLLLGTDYVLLREEFLKSERRTRTAEVPLKLLITMGGNDRPNASGRLLSLLESTPSDELAVRVIAGATNSHYADLRSFCDNSAMDVKLVYATDDMPRHMQWADLAIAAAGITAWELLYLGVPTALLAITDSQREMAKQLARTGAALNLGWHADIDGTELLQRLTLLKKDQAQLANLSMKARQLIDGKGLDRLLAAMREWKPLPVPNSL